MNNFRENVSTNVKPCLCKQIDEMAKIAALELSGSEKCARPRKSNRNGSGEVSEHAKDKSRVSGHKTVYCCALCSNAKSSG